MIKEFCEESLENHRIGNVGDLKLVEADQPGILLNQLSDGRNRIERLWLSGVCVAYLKVLDFVNFLMYFGHKRIEVNALLL